MFLLKKVIAAFLMPLPIFFILSAIGFYLLRRGKRRRGKQLLGVAFVWIALLSYAPFTSQLLKPLESQYARWHADGTPVAYVHVLGFGHDSDGRLPLSSKPFASGLVRIVEGIAIYRQNPGAKLIFSGYEGEDEVSNARINADVAEALGVDPADIIVLKCPRDTAEEAAVVRKIAGDAKVALVTSAMHMPRAMLLFEKEDFNVIAAPTDFQTRRFEWYQLPGAQGLRLSQLAFHEYIGLLWAKLRSL